MRSRKLEPKIVGRRAARVVYLVNLHGALCLLGAVKGRQPRMEIALASGGVLPPTSDINPGGSPISGSESRVG